MTIGTETMANQHAFKIGRLAKRHQTSLPDRSSWVIGYSLLDIKSTNIRHSTLNIQ
jgi:hypothetical protein